MKYEFWTIGDLATAEVLNLYRPTPFVENWNYIESRVSRVLFVDIQNVFLGTSLSLQGIQEDSKGISKST